MKNHSFRRLRIRLVGWNWSGFFSNFTAVVLGIVITFVGSDLLQEHATQRDIKEMMQLIKTELVANRAEVVSAQEWYLNQRRVASYILSNEGNYQRDTLNMYSPLVFQLISVESTNDALDMLKVSGLMQKIAKKEHVMQIIKAYRCIDSTVNGIQSFRNMKEDAFARLSADKAFLTFDGSKFDNVGKWNFYIQLPVMHQLLETIITYWFGNPFDDDIAAIDEAIAAIEKAD
ncbi:MAG: hypothetical protein LBL97_03380 [Prevotellaceae bacterium]|nr:hypothetical protein [Prevotellaceae bacterium]